MAVPDDIHVIISTSILTQMLTKSGRVHVVSALSEKEVSEALQLSPQADNKHASTDPQLSIMATAPSMALII